jgi:hypothetical protein
MEVINMLNMLNQYLISDLSKIVIKNLYYDTVTRTAYIIFCQKLDVN